LRILRRRDIVRRIKAALNLPDDIIVETDDHYRCAVCLRRGSVTGKTR
jgi:hypothetical protein